MSLQEGFLHFLFTFCTRIMIYYIYSYLANTSWLADTKTTANKKMMAAPEDRSDQNFNENSDKEYIVFLMQTIDNFTCQHAFNNVFTWIKSNLVFMFKYSGGSHGFSYRCAAHMAPRHPHQLHQFNFIYCWLLKTNVQYSNHQYFYVRCKDLSLPQPRF